MDCEGLSTYSSLESNTPLNSSNFTSIAINSTTVTIGYNPYAIANTMIISITTV